jgi:hypothetical protein
MKARPAKYPFLTMNVGDSFLVPGKSAAQFSQATNYANRTNPGKRFKSRTVEGGVRVWRVS